MDNPELSVHKEGHRDRLRYRLTVNGSPSFKPEEYLEMLLTYCIPRRDTKPIAEALINKFGNIRGVMYAPKSELKKIEGLGDSAYLFIELLSDLRRRIKADILSVDRSVAIEEFKKLFSKDIAEMVCGVYYDKDANFCGSGIIYIGNMHSVRMPDNAVTDEAVKNKATYVVIAHNHPSGSIFPSADDLITNERIADLLELKGIELSASYIFGKNGAYSDTL